MSITAIDFAEQALTRIAQQYRDKPKYVALVQSLCGFVQSGIDDPLEYVITLYDIDTAEGHNLDVIGEIVGQDRVLIDYDLLSFFGYEGAANSGTYGDFDDPNIGARYISAGEDEVLVAGGETTLSDPEYRTFIKARILRNYSTSTPEEVIGSIKLVLSVNQVELTEGVMSIDLISVDRPLSENELVLLSNYDILPRPTGVSLGAIDSYSSIAFSGANDWGSGEFDYMVWE